MLGVTVMVTDDSSAGGDALSSTQLIIVEIADGSTIPRYRVTQLNPAAQEDVELSFTVNGERAEDDFIYVIEQPANNGTLTLTGMARVASAIVTSLFHLFIRHGFQWYRYGYDNHNG